MEKMKLADYFIGEYPVSKTLRFELKPIGKTLENIEKDGILGEDIERAENYKKVKKIIDRYHKKFIESVLSELELEGLDEYYRLYTTSKRDEKEEKQFSNIKSDMRKQIANAFKSNKIFETLFKEKLIKKDLIYFIEGNDEEVALVKAFDKFTTYFKGFHENRKNLYSDEEKSTAIAYRIVHQNLPKFIDNIRIYELVKCYIPESDLESHSNSIKKKYEGICVDDYFNLEGFNLVLSQTGIDCYNAILGAYAEDEKTKVQGLNEYINLYNQHLDKSSPKIPKLKVLFKQILSDRDITNDKGYDCLCSYWKGQGIFVERIGINTASVSKKKDVKKKKESKVEKANLTSLEEICKLLNEEDEPEVVLDIFNRFKTKQAINNGLAKHFKDSKKSSEVYRKLKTLMKEKKKS